MARRTNYSRLSRRVENQSKRNLFLSILGIIIIITLMIVYGIPLLANFTGFISGLNKSNNISSGKKSGFVSAPTLDPLPQATNSSEFTITGQAQSGQSVSIYLNSALSDSKDVGSDRTFSFKVFLKEGDNKIKTQASENGNKSDFSDEKTLSYISKAPTLDLKSPSDGQNFSKDQNQIQVTGSTDPGVKVTVNDFWALMDENNNFSYTLNLQNGDNNIKIVATDQAGSKTEKSIKVVYSP